MDDAVGARRLSLPPELKARTRRFNAHPIRPDGRYVLVWLQQTLRGHDYPAIDAAVSIGNDLGKPVLVYHGLREDYPYASARIHRFILGASAAMARTLEKRGIACIQFVDRSAKREKGLVYRLAEQACCIIADQHFTFIPATQPKRVAQKLPVAMMVTDACRFVPTNVLPDDIGSTISFRAHHTRLREEWLEARGEVEPRVAPYAGPLPFEPDRLGAMSEAEIDALVSTCTIDQSLPAAADFPATETAAQKRLEQLAETVLLTYKSDRNNPAIATSSSRLSPYLRFGMLSVHEVVRACHRSAASSADRWKFFDELLTWREWSHYRAAHVPDFHRFPSLPERARATMYEHRDDARDIFPIEALLHGETDDALWNAAQRQWLATGWMHNNPRMYWSSQLLRWTRSPEEAWALGCYLNDRLSLDGRDPATYAGMRWGFGESRPANRENPIFGWLMRQTGGVLKGRKGVDRWIAEMNAQPVPRLAASDWPVRRQDYL